MHQKPHDFPSSVYVILIGTCGSKLTNLFSSNLFYVANKLDNIILAMLNFYNLKKYFNKTKNGRWHYYYLS